MSVEALAAPPRTPCKACGAAILVGAKKCKSCKKWQVDPRPQSPSTQRFPRSAIIVSWAVAAVMAVIVTGRESPVGEAPPLTALASDSASAPAEMAPDLTEPEPPRAIDPKTWRAREIQIGEFHPLAIAMHPNGQSIYVSGDDATLREYKLKTGELIHKASMPAQGDELRVLFGRYVALLRHEDAARIPVMDTTAWNKDPLLLQVGPSPGDILELPDGHSVIATTVDGSRVTRFDLPSGTRLANITLPHATGQLFLVRAEGRPYVAAMGELSFGGRPAGGWVDLFDPTETPFGATRRSIPAGRELGAGMVSADGGAIFFADRVSNTARLLRIASTTESKIATVGQGPRAAFLINDDKHGITLNADKTASVVDIATMKTLSTLVLDGVARTGVVSPDRRTLFVALGGPDLPPQGSGVAIIAGDPPNVVASLPTGKGAIAVAVAKDGSRAAVASYYDRSITLLEP